MIRTRALKLNYNSWGFLSFISILTIIAPNLHIIANVFSPANENWVHIKTYLLKDYMVNSVYLILFTGLFTVMIGVSLAWMISVYDFPLRRLFQWMLILPLAIPPYMAAYTYHGILNYTGVIQTFFRNRLAIQVNQRYFDIMSMEGAIFIFTLSLFPYIYIITKSFLEKQSSALIENARLLGKSPVEIFLFVVLPVSRAAIIGGVSLVILEVLNDYGVVQYFGIPTFSTAIFKTWFSMGDVDSAIKLSSVLMILIFGVLLVEKGIRGRKRFSYTTTKIRPIIRQRLKGVPAMITSLYCFLILGLGFIIPTGQLIHWSLLTYRKILNIKFLGFIINSISIAFISAALILVMAVIIANYCRIKGHWMARIYSKITVVGYSIPGAVIAIGVIVFFISLDQRMYWFYRVMDKSLGKLVLSTSIAMLIFAYVIRFLAIGYNAVEAAFEKVGNKFFEASTTLGMSMTETFFRVDLRMIRSGVIGGFILVFVDILKELPLTLILRPFNFHTLATKSFQYANDEMIHEAAISSLIIIIISVMSIYFFNKMGDREGA